MKTICKCSSSVIDTNKPINDNIINITPLLTVVLFSYSLSFLLNAIEIIIVKNKPIIKLKFQFAKFSNTSPKSFFNGINKKAEREKIIKTLILKLSFFSSLISSFFILTTSFFLIIEQLETNKRNGFLSTF